MEREPSNAIARVRLSEFELIHEDAPAALAAAQRAVELAPDDYRTHVQLGIVRRAQVRELQIVGDAPAGRALRAGPGLPSTGPSSWPNRRRPTRFSRCGWSAPRCSRAGKGHRERGRRRLPRGDRGHRGPQPAGARSSQRFGMPALSRTRSFAAGCWSASSRSTPRPTLRGGNSRSSRTSRERRALPCWSPWSSFGRRRPRRTPSTRAIWRAPASPTRPPRICSKTQTRPTIRRACWLWPSR